MNMECDSNLKTCDGKGRWHGPDKQLEIRYSLKTALLQNHANCANIWNLYTYTYVCHYHLTERCVRDLIAI